MTTNTLHPLAADYLERLRRAGRSLPRDRLRELSGDIEAHLAEAIARDASDIQALTILDRLGKPDEIIAAEVPQMRVPSGRPGTREWAAILLVLFGGFFVGVGWIAGLVLLWSSRAWTTRQKWIGALLIPGGLATAVFAAGFGATKQTCYAHVGAPLRCTPGSSPTWHVAILALAVVPCIVAVYLARTAK